MAEPRKWELDLMRASDEAHHFNARATVVSIVTAKLAAVAAVEEFANKVKDLCTELVVDLNKE